MRHEPHGGQLAHEHHVVDFPVLKHERCDVDVTLHDEDLVDEVATRIWHFSLDGIEDFTGPYAEYMSAATAR